MFCSVRTQACKRGREGCRRSVTWDLGFGTVSVRAASPSRVRSLTASDRRAVGAADVVCPWYERSARIPLSRPIDIARQLSQAFRR